ncbi:MAG: metalloregulator ArsR/SmtB family transcription factor [Methylococcaceae bacterium]
MLQPVSYFKCLSDETRLRCMLLLHNEGELCVCELTYALGLSQPKISRHLAQLRQYGLLQHSRKGQWVYYKINSALPEWTMTFLNEASAVLDQTPLYKQDVLRLQGMADRPIGESCCN